jgi:hypothetical protein
LKVSELMTRILMTGRAEWGNEAFDFEIGPWSDGIGLMMRHAGYGNPSLTGGGIWPSAEKAQEIALSTVQKLLHPDCEIEWKSVAI